MVCCSHEKISLENEKIETDAVFPPSPTPLRFYARAQPALREGRENQARDGIVQDDGSAHWRSGRRSGELLAQSGGSEGIDAGVLSRPVF